MGGDSDGKLNQNPERNTDAESGGIDPWSYGGNTRSVSNYDCSDCSNHTFQMNKKWGKGVANRYE